MILADRHLLFVKKWAGFPLSILFYASLLCFVFTDFAFCQATDEKTELFRLTAWPSPESMVHEATESSVFLSQLVNGWYKGHLPTYIGKGLQIEISETDSLERYTESVLKTMPDALEGDLFFVNRKINHAEKHYIPLVAYCPPHRSIEADIIFRTNRPIPVTTLGIVSPDCQLGGRAQIEYWTTNNSQPFTWVPFHSPDETLRHLIAGTIEAAAVPGNTLAPFLRKQGREDFARLFHTLHIPLNSPVLCVFLREDHYNNPFLRTVLRETWLRNTMPQSFFPVPAGLDMEMMRNLFPLIP